MPDVYLTKEGFEKLKNELAKLKEERNKLTEEIEDARLQGDLSENAGYTYAKDKKNIVMDRINELELKMRTAKLVDSSVSDKEIVGLGAEVTVREEDTAKEKIYTLTSEDEADPLENKISVSSPLAQAILGKKCGDSVTVKLPNKEKQVSVAKIYYK